MPLTPAPHEKIGGYRWSVVALLFFATTINYIDRQVLGMLKPVIAGEIHLSEADYGYIVSAFQAAYAIGLLVVGRLIDRFGTRLSYALSIAVWSLAGCLHAAARGALGFGIARFALGLGESANFPAAIKATAEWFPKRERALATGIFNAGSNIGAVVSPLIVTYLTVAYGWQVAFLVTGSLGFVWMICWLLLYRLPQHSKRVGAAELAYIRQDDAAEAADGHAAAEHGSDDAAPAVEAPVEAPARQNAAPSAERIDWRRLLTQRATIGITLARFVCDWVWWFFLFWTPDFLEKSFGVDIRQMVLPLIVIYTFSSFGGIFGGYLSSALIRRGRTVPFARKAALLLCALLVVPVATIPGTGSLWTAIGLISLACFAHQGWASNIYTLVSDYYPRERVATMTSLAGFAGSVGGVLAASAVGNLLELTGSYFVVFLMAGLAYLAAWGCLQLFLPRKTAA